MSLLEAAALEPSDREGALQAVWSTAEVDVYGFATVLLGCGGAAAARAVLLVRSRRLPVTESARACSYYLS